MSVKPATLPALVSVIVLNYNGARTIANVVESLNRQTYSNFEIIVVDNDSQNGSVEYLHGVSEAGQLRAIFSPQNLGFSGGNNLGILAARGENIALLNNDGIPEPRWLEELVRVLESDPKTAAVNSKLLLYPNFTSVTVAHNDLNEVIAIRQVKSKLLSLLQQKSLELTWTDLGESRLEVEIPLHPDGESVTTIEVVTLDKHGDQFSEPFEIDVTKSATTAKIQNAGIVMFPSGYARDRGALVRASQQHYETDQNQFQDGGEVYAVCAGASLYRRSLFDVVGLFDEQFFLYYEDVELSERLRLAGYNCRYAAKAVVRHLHAASSKEGSDFFNFNAERGRLFHLILHFPFVIMLRELCIFCAYVGKKTLRRNFTPLKILFSVLRNSIGLTIKRLRYSNNFSGTNRKIWQQDLLSGRWLFRGRV